MVSNLRTVIDIEQELFFGVEIDLFSAELDSGLQAMERGDWVNAQKSFYRLAQWLLHYDNS